MRIHIVSIFPEIFDSFIATSLIKKAIKKKLLKFVIHNPRDFCNDKHQTIDDEIYGGGAGMLMKAKPIIDCIENIIKTSKILLKSDYKIIYLSPSDILFNQKVAQNLSISQNIIFVCGRYEGIDDRFVTYMSEKYKDKFMKLSIGKFITLGGEMPCMTIIESIVRLVPGVIKEELSWQDESYNPDTEMQNIEYPQYTRPGDVFGYKVPEVLLSGNHKKIEAWRKDNTLLFQNT